MRSACAENTAKLVPRPSQVAPSGYGEPGDNRSGYGAMNLRLGPEHDGGERRKRQLERLLLPVRRAANGVDRAFVPRVATAIEARVRIGDLAPGPGMRHADAVVMAWHRRHVADDQNRRAAFRSKAQIGEHRIG